MLRYFYIGWEIIKTLNLFMFMYIYTVCPPKKWDYRNFEICNIFFSVKMLCKIKIKAMFKFSDSRGFQKWSSFFVLFTKIVCY